jgi:glucose-1-phosphate cytidylyltransferase
VLEPAVLDTSRRWHHLENEPMRRLAEDGQLMSHLHRGFWQPMDTLRDRMLLEAHWKNGEAHGLWR